MANTRTYVHTEHTLVDKAGNETVMFSKNTLADVVTSEKSKVTAVGKIIFYAVCTTAAGTAEKTVNVPGFALVDGAHLTVKFNSGNTATNATLNVNNTGAKAIKMKGANLRPGVILANDQIILKYNGSSFDVIAGAGSTHVSKDNAKKFYLIGTADGSLNGTPANEYYNTQMYVNAAGDTLVSPKFAGDGSGVTNMNATNIATGTLHKDRLANSGATAGSYGSGTNATLGFGDTFKIPYTTVDAKGRVTAIKEVSLKLPSNPDTDVKVTTTANNSATFYIAGTGTAATSTGTLVHNTGVYVQSNRLKAPAFQSSTMYFGADTQYITGSAYTGQAATVAGIGAHLEDGLASTSTAKAATANAARKLSAGITSLISQLGTQATFSLSGTTLTITTKAAPSVSLA